MPRREQQKPVRRIGRPPAGEREGEKVKDYPQLSIRLPVDVKAKLQALSLVSARPQWRLISEAIECYLRERSPDEQRQVHDFVGRTHRKPPSAGRATRRLKR